MSQLTRSAATVQLVFHVLLTVMLFSLFIVAFFFVFAANIERTVVQTSVTDLVTELVAEIKVGLGADEIASIAAAVKDTQLSDAEASDAAVQATNSALLKKAMIVLGSAAAGVLFVIGVVYFVMVYLVQKNTPSIAVAGVGYPDMKKVFLVAILGFLSVIATEFLFLYTVPARFKPLDTNQAKQTIIKSLLFLVDPQ